MNPTFPIKAPNKLNTDKTILAYVAGLVDAEGTFVLSPVGSRYCRLVICVYGNDPALLFVAQESIGGKIRRVKRKNRSAKHKDSYILAIENIEGVRRACEALQSHLVLKKDQCTMLLKSCDLSSKERFILREDLKKLNAKGASTEEIRIVGTQRDLERPSETEWAYFAGWVEGDGYVNFQPQKFKSTRYWYPWVSVYSTKLGPLKYLHDIFGGNLKTRPRKGKVGWSLEGSLKFVDQTYVKKILPKLIPHFRIKKKLAEIVLESLDYPANERGFFVEEFNKESSR